MFGSTNTFGTPNKPTGFGTPLNFGTPSTQSQPRLGGFGTNTATPAINLGGFGSTGTTFGAPAANQSFGGFGSTTTSTATQAFGSTFGAPAASTSNTSLFGTPAVSKPLFGATPVPSLFSSNTPAQPSLFGAPTQTTQATSLFGSSTGTTGAFGTSTFGAPAATQPSLFGTTGGFGTQQATGSTAPSLFGTGTTGLGTGLGSNLGGGLGTSGFGGFKPASTAPSFGFGTTNTNTLGGFGTGGGTTGGFGGFGSTSLGTGGLFGQQQQQQSQQDQNAAKVQQTLASFYAINVFGDERDDILKKWNMLQACWGTGKGFYSSQAPPVEYDTCNPFYRFKAISYVVIPTMDNADGYVKLVFNKKEADLSAIKQSILTGLNGVLGNKPNLTVSIVHIKALSDSETEMMITVSEKGVTGTSRKIQAADLAAYFNQAAQKQQLTGAGVTTISAYVAPSKAQLEEYLKEPPSGIDEQLWKAAQIDNPMPSKYLPLPIMGFANLKKRMLCEEFETGLHQGFLTKVNKEIVELKKKHAASLAQIAEQKQKFLQLQHRVLKILVKQECTRKMGLVLQPEEEILRGRLEMMYTHLNMPTQFRGKINEMLSTLKIDSYCQDNNKQQNNNKNEVYKMDPDGQEELKQFLMMQQRGISHLIAIVNQDLSDLKVITEGMNQLLRN